MLIKRFIWNQLLRNNARTIYIKMDPSLEMGPFLCFAPFIDLTGFLKTSRVYFQVRAAMPRAIAPKTPAWLPSPGGTMYESVCSRITDDCT
jgi:hypothetical protein